MNWRIIARGIKTNSHGSAAHYAVIQWQDNYTETATLAVDEKRRNRSMSFLLEQEVERLVQARNDRLTPLAVGS